MRIISGKFKGTKLFIPLNKETRPLKDIVKESIFNTLIHFKKKSFKLKDSNILDLYSGTGSFGLECLSRDADKTVFVENNINALKILQKNIYKISIEKKTLIFKESVLSFLSNIKKLNFKLDLIFIDPPYNQKDIFELVDTIFKKKILKKNGLIVIHRNKKSDDIYPNNFKVLDVKIYGISKIIFGNLAS